MGDGTRAGRAWWVRRCCHRQRPVHKTAMRGGNGFPLQFDVPVAYPRSRPRSSFPCMMSRPTRCATEGRSASPCTSGSDDISDSVVVTRSTAEEWSEIDLLDPPPAVGTGAGEPKRRHWSCHGRAVEYESGHPGSAPLVPSDLHRCSLAATAPICFHCFSLLLCAP